MKMKPSRFHAKRIRELREQRLAASRTFHESVARATRRYEAVVADLDDQESSLQVLKGEPIVLVRRGGSGTYHVMGSRCGWIPWDTDSLYQSEAEAQGARPCSSYPCKRALERWAESEEEATEVA